MVLLIYVILFSASLFALLFLLSSFDVQQLSECISPQLPRRLIGAFLIVSGAILLLVWLLLSIIPALSQGKSLAFFDKVDFINGSVLVSVIFANIIFTKTDPSVRFRAFRREKVNSPDTSTASCYADISSSI